MSAILDLVHARIGAVFAQIVLLLSLAVYSSYGGGCNFPKNWTGSWFQSGNPGLIAINSTHIQSKGECYEIDSSDKFLLYDRSDDCYRCIVIHEKHEYVLQYKETYCSPKDSLWSICDLITGDAPLFSMFRKEPRPTPQPCPFHPPPFTFTYNRGSGDCANPPSRAESCTDDSRLLLRYMACPDVPSTESNVEELVCLATWKEGSTRYLVGQIYQVQRNSIASDEDTYRCFIYKGQHSDKSMTYTIAQSGDATCNGVSSPTDGSRTMKLTNSDDEHNRCHFPAWIVEHHKWFSLDHSHQYHFTTRNATLKVITVENQVEEKRLVCHSILEQKEKKYITLVAHVTRGCESGHACLRFHRRSSGVLELQQGAVLWDSPQDACANTDHLPYITLTKSLGDTEEAGAGCEEHRSASVGCGQAQDTLELKTNCNTEVYTCYGSWQDGASGFIIASPVERTSSQRSTYCFMYTQNSGNDSHSGATLALSAVAGRCDRSVVPGRAGDKAYNLTVNGTCEQSSKFNSFAPNLTPAAILLTSLALLSVR